MTYPTMTIKKKSFKKENPQHKTRKQVWQSVSSNRPSGQTPVPPPPKKKKRKEKLNLKTRKNKN
jgi:hypothetical protein